MVQPSNTPDQELSRPAVTEPLEDRVVPTTLQRRKAARGRGGRITQSSAPPLPEILSPQPRHHRVNFTSVVRAALATEHPQRAPRNITYPAVAQFTEYLSTLPHPGDIRPPPPPAAGRIGSPPYPRSSPAPTSGSGSRPSRSVPQLNHPRRTLSSPPPRVSRFTEHLSSLPPRHPLDAPPPVPPKDSVYVPRPPPPPRSFEIPPGVDFTPGSGLRRQLGYTPRPLLPRSTPSTGARSTSRGTRANPVGLIRSATDRTPLDPAVGNRYWHPMLEEWLEFPSVIEDDEREEREDLLKNYWGTVFSRFRGLRKDKRDKGGGAI